MPKQAVLVPGLGVLHHQVQKLWYHHHQNHRQMARQLAPLVAGYACHRCGAMPGAARDPLSVWHQLRVQRQRMVLRVSPLRHHLGRQPWSHWQPWMAYGDAGPGLVGLVG